MKKFILASAVVLTVVSCNKKEEGSITTQETTTTNPETSTSTTVTPIDSTTAVKETTTATSKEQTTTTKTTTGEVYHYVSHDGKTKFSAIYDADKGTAAIKNETSGKTYEMKNVPSGSGAKYADSEGYYFWEHQGEFYFGKDDQELVTGVKSK